MMTASPIQTNTLFYGDNLQILRDYIQDECIDLIYLDPPFNSNRSYNVLFKNEAGMDAEAQITAFEDTWHWGVSTEATYHEIVTNSPTAISDMIGALRSFIGENQMMAYLVMMTARLSELRRVLKPTGSLFLHCDPTASHYLKIVLDTLFGPDNFINEIIWQRTAVKGDVRKKFGSVHDVLLAYSKTENFKFQSQYAAQDEEYSRRFRFDDKDGRGPYQSAPLDSPNPRPNLTYSYKGYPPPQKGWRVSEDLMKKLDEDGRLIFPTSKSGRIRRKVYLNEQNGPKITDVWTDIPPLQASSAERLGYPTQKPLEMLERIIEAGSQEGDWVLDPFCGCGTAISAAQKLNRKWIGIDITHLSIALQKYRLKDMFNIEAGSDYRVIGEPTTLGSAAQLAKEDRYQFQWWALSLVKAKPLGGHLGQKSGKKGSDKGIDGVINFIDDAKGNPKRVLIQVKSGKVSVKDIRDLVGTVEREKAAIGIFLTLDAPTSPMLAEAAAAGFYQSPLWQKEYAKIQIFTVEALLAGSVLDIPPAYSNFKQAERILREEGEQGALF